MHLKNGMMNSEVRDRYDVICTFGVSHGVSIYWAIWRVVSYRI
jgi:hypothetical protein